MDGQRVRILLVEDDRSHAELILRAFEAHSGRLQVSLAGTIREARTALAETAVDLVIADWRLPDGDAGDLLLARPAEARYPVVILTGQGDQTLAVDALKRGALDYVVKTEATIAELPRTVERALREWGHIVERRRAEEMFRNLLESAPDAMVIIDVDGNIVLVNAQIENLFGYSRDELIGRPIEMLMSPPRAEQRRIERLRYFRNPGCRTVASPWDLAVRRKDGREVPVEISLSPISTAGRSFVAAAIRDVTARRAAENEVRRSERIWRATLDALPSHIAILDERGEVVAVNASWQRFADANGLPPRYREGGWNYLDVCDDVEGADAPQAATVAAAIRMVASGRREAFACEYPCHSPDEQRWFELHVSRFAGKGPQWVVIAHEDITERRRNEQERTRLEHGLREAQKMEALGRLAGGIAHDFNNVLTAIRGNVEQARSSLPRGAPARPPLEMVERASREASDVTRSLLTFTHRAKTESTPLDLRAHVHDSVRIFGRLLPAVIEIRNGAVADDPVWVCANVTQIQQILMNLVVNARDAMPDGGTLRLSVRREDSREGKGFSVQGDAEASTAVLTIQDDRVGMTEYVRARAFEPFFTTKTRGQGTGLGLSVVHGIVADLGGRIDVETALDSGTQVTVRLPCCSPPAPRPEGLEIRNGQKGHGGLILLAEDNEFVRSVVATSLASAGYEVIQVADGLAAMKAFNRVQGSLRLAVLDVDLPGQSGMRCIEQMRRQRPELLIVVITGSVGLEIEASETQVLLRKPFLTSDLTRIVVGMLAEAEGMEAPV